MGKTVAVKYKIAGGVALSLCLAFIAVQMVRFGSQLPSADNSEERADNRVKRDATRQLVDSVSEPEALSLHGRLNLAKELVDNGEVDEAADALEQIIEEDPGNIRALLEISLIELLDRGRPQEALPHLIKALKVDPSNDHLLGEVADIYVETGQFSAGLKFFSKLREHVPNTPAINLRMGQILFYKGSYKKALMALNASNLSSRYDGQATSIRARIYLHLGKVEKSLKEYQLAEDKMERRIRAAMVAGETSDFLVKWLETMQIEMAEGLIEKNLYREAENVLYRLSEKIPSDPEVIKLMDLAKLGLQDNAG